MNTFILILQVLAVISGIIFLFAAWNKETKTYNLQSLKSAAFFGVVFFGLNFLKSNKVSPEGTYYYSNNTFNTEFYVYLNEDGTWYSETFESGKKIDFSITSQKGKWKLINIHLKSSRGEDNYSLITFNDDNTAYLFDNGCIKPLPDEIISHNDNKFTWAEVPFGSLTNEERCKSK